MKTIEYYLMRHASYYGNENQYVNHDGFITLQHSVSRLKAELEEKFPKKNLRIIHSVLPRAKHTALLMQEMMTDVKTFCRSDPRLNSDKLQIDDDYINEVVSYCEKENEICLILSHEPDIKDFCKKELKTSEWVKMSTEIKDKPAQVSESDDLPF